MFKDKEVEKMVKYKLGIFDDSELAEEKLNTITEIFISNIKANGERLNVDLSDLVQLRKLKALELKGFELGEDVLRVIHDFPELITLRFYGCHAKEPVSIHIEKLKSLVLDHCQSINLSETYFPENVLIIDGGVVDISKFQNNRHLKRLEIKNSEITHATLFGKIPSLRSLNVDGSTLDDEDIVNQLRAKRMAVSNEFEYHPLE